MKTLGAACATSGGIALWHGENITAEAEWASQYLDGIETIIVEKSDLDESREMLIEGPDNPIYCIGCPHCSLKEIEEIANLVKGKELHGKLWVFTSRGVYEQAEKAGLIKVIAYAGGKIYGVAWSWH